MSEIKKKKKRGRPPKKVKVVEEEIIRVEETNKEQKESKIVDEVEVMPSLETPKEPKVVEENVKDMPEKQINQDIKIDKQGFVTLAVSEETPRMIVREREIAIKDITDIQEIVFPMLEKIGVVDRTFVEIQKNDGFRYFWRGTKAEFKEKLNQEKKNASDK